MPELIIRILRDTFSMEDRLEWSRHASGRMWRRRQTDDLVRRHGVEPVNLEYSPAESYLARLLRNLWFKSRFGGSILWKHRLLGAATFGQRLGRPVGHNWKSLARMRTEPELVPR